MCISTFVEQEDVTRDDRIHALQTRVMESFTQEPHMREKVPINCCMIRVACQHNQTWGKGKSKSKTLRQTAATKFSYRSN